MLIVFFGATFAVAGEVETTGAVTGDEAPSIELLEFLGEWETFDGEWIDPLEVDEVMDEGEGDG